LLDGLNRNAAHQNRSLNNNVESVLIAVVYNESNEDTKAAIEEVMNRKECLAEDLYDQVDEMLKALCVYLSQLILARADGGNDTTVNE
jgi:cytochrome c1